MSSLKKLFGTAQWKLGVRKLFHKHDSDKNQYLDDEELLPLLQDLFKQPLLRHHPKYLRLTPALCTALLKEFDRNKNGKLDIHECR